MSLDDAERSSRLGKCGISRLSSYLIAFLVLMVFNVLHVTFLSTKPSVQVVFNRSLIMYPLGFHRCRRQHQATVVGNPLNLVDESVSENRESTLAAPGPIGSEPALSLEDDPFDQPDPSHDDSRVSLLISPSRGDRVSHRGARRRR